MIYLRFLLVVTFLAPSSSLHADLVTATFESPDYSLGSVVGQNGWVASDTNNGGEAIVDASNSASGSQALMIDTDNLGGPSWWYKPFSTDAAGKVIDISFDLFLETNAGDNYSIFGIDIYNEASAFSVFRLWTEYDSFDGETYINTSEGITFVPVTRGTWNQFEVTLDYAREEYDLYLNGQWIETGLIDVGLVGTTLSDVDVWTTTPSGFGDRAWYDNFHVSVVPEPATSSILALGLLAIVGRRNRRVPNSGAADAA